MKSWCSIGTNGMGSFALSSSFEHEANKSGRTKHASAISNFDLGSFIFFCVSKLINNREGGISRKVLFVFANKSSNALSDNVVLSRGLNPLKQIIFKIFGSSERLFYVEKSSLVYVYKDTDSFFYVLRIADSLTCFSLY